MFDVGDTAYFGELRAKLIVLAQWPKPEKGRYRMLVHADIFSECSALMERFDVGWPDCEERAEQLRKTIYTYVCKKGRYQDLHVIPLSVLSTCRTVLLEYEWS